MSSRRRIAVGVAVTLLLGALVPPAVGGAPPAPGAAIEPTLEAILDRLGPDDTVRVVAVLRSQVDPRTIRGSDRRARRQALVSALKRTADAGQVGLRASIARLDPAGAHAVTPLWIVNAVALTASTDVVRELAARSDVARLSVEASIVAPAPEIVAQTGPPFEANLVQIGAPAMWALGQLGGGAIVASLDTGVDLSNPDLAAAWRGGSNSWFDPYGQHPTTPADVNGHGTQTLGISVGGTAGGSAIGVAPSAGWIAAKIFNDSDVATSTGIHQAFQWVLDPDANPFTDDAPDVVNASWAIGAPACDLSFEPDLAALVGAGIVPVFAGGNFGPDGATSASPANNPSAFAVGAVDDGDAIAPFSSLGPTACGRPVPATFPTVVAPGVDIRTSDRFGLYGSGSGTSYSAPHVSGAIALLRGAVPGATVDQLESALVGAAVDLGPPGPDDTFGAGRIDVRAAYDRLVAAPTPTPTPTPSPTATPTPTPIADGDGPIVGLPALAPNPANGSADVIVSAVVDDRSTGGSAIADAELWIDADGPPGTGATLLVGPGGALVTASGSLTMSVQAGLGEGAHVIVVRARDAAGNWGPASTAALVVDRTGPGIGGAHVVPEPSQGSASITLEATASDAAGAPIAVAEWFSGADPGLGLGTSMDPLDGTFDSPTEAVTTVVPARPPYGERVVFVRALDASGNWGEARPVAFLVTPSDGLFADGFETADLSAWTSATGASRLRAAATAATAGLFGLAATVRGSSPAYVSDASPRAETNYHARFTLDARGTSTGGRAVRLFAGRDGHGTTILVLEYRRTATGSPWVRAGARRAGGMSYTGWTRLGSGPHVVELGWSSARSSRLRLWIDRVARPGRSGLDTHAFRLETIRLGPSAGLATGLRGTFAFDRFVSDRGSWIGR